MRTISVRVIPNAKKASVVEENGVLKVHVPAPPSGGKANKMLVEILAEHLGVKKSRIRIASGHKSREKVVQVED